MPAVYFYALLALGGLAALRFILLMPFALLDDEAYYWTWSLIPSAAYFDHTGGIGLVGWAWQKIVGLDFLGFRVLFSLLSLVTGFASLAAVLTLLPIHDRQWGVNAQGLALAIFVIATTTLQMTHSFWTPDVLLYPFLSLALWQICRLLSPYETVRPLRAWAWAGLFLGLGMMGKGTMVLPAAFLCLIAVIAPALRADLRQSPWPWIGLGLIVLGGLPTLIWNAQNDWIMVAFQQGNVVTGRRPNANKEAVDLILFFLVLLGPALLIARTRIGATWSWLWPLWAVFLGTFALFAFLAIQRGLILSWAFPTLHLGIILSLGMVAVKSGGRWRWFAGIGGALITLIAIAGLSLRDQAIQAQNTMPALVWPGLYDDLEAVRTQLETQYGEPVLALGNHYQEASQLNYARTQANAFVAIQSGPAENRTLLPALNYGGRVNQYDLVWQDLTLGGYLALVVQRQGSPPPAELFEEVLTDGLFETEGDPFAYRFGRLVENPRPLVRAP